MWCFRGMGCLVDFHAKETNHAAFFGGKPLPGVKLGSTAKLVPQLLAVAEKIANEQAEHTCSWLWIFLWLSSAETKITQNRSVLRWSAAGATIITRFQWLWLFHWLHLDVSEHGWLEWKYGIFIGQYCKYCFIAESGGHFTRYTKTRHFHWDFIDFYCIPCLIWSIAILYFWWSHCLFCVCVSILYIFVHRVYLA